MHAQKVHWDVLGCESAILLLYRLKVTVKNNPTFKDCLIGLKQVYPDSKVLEMNFE
jgi:hypothetical protein